MQGGGDLAADRGLARAGLAGDQADGAQLQQMLQARLRPRRGWRRRTAHPVVQSVSKGKAVRAKCLRYISVSSGVRIARGQLAQAQRRGRGAWVAGPSTARVRDGRSRLTKQLA